MVLIGKNLLMHAIRNKLMIARKYHSILVRQTVLTVVVSHYGIFA